MRSSLLIISAMMSGAALAADVEVNNCIIQEVLPGKNMTGAFVTFDNESEQPVVLKKAAVDSVSKRVELHEMKHEDGVMKMQEIANYALQPGETAFKKGSYHVMILDIPKVPEVGSEHEMTFTFADGETATCDAKVLSVDDVIAHFDAEGDMEHHHEHGAKGGEHHHEHGAEGGEQHNHDAHKEDHKQDS